MKPIKNLLAISALFAVVACGEELPDPDNFSLDGRWETEYGNVIQVDGTDVSWVEFSAEDKYLQAALAQGFVTEDMPPIINLASTGTLGWTAERFLFAYNESEDGKVTVVHGEYVEAEVTLSLDGNTITTTGTAPDTFPEAFAGKSFSFKLTRVE